MRHKDAMTARIIGNIVILRPDVASASSLLGVCFVDVLFPGCVNDASFGGDVVPSLHPAQRPEIG